MEPKLPAPNFQPEQPPVAYDHTEQVSITIPEVAAEKSSEQLERHAETSQSGATPVLPPPIVGAAQQPSQSAPAVAPAAVGDTPLVAADEDLIEKEWVDKAKKIIEETKDDPYRREQEVGKLQADYLRKRYGKELGTSR
jgi:hypothetical protein